MNFDLTLPRRGDRLSASREARIIAEIRANRLLPSPGVLISRGPNGTHISIAAAGRGRSAAADKGCWRIVAETVEAEGATGTVHYMDRQYYQVGGILQQGSDRTTLESFVEAGTPFIAARIAYSGGSSDAPLSWYGAQLHGYASLADMIADSLDRRYSVIPLYELKLPAPSGDNNQEESGEENVEPTQVVVVTDFRAIPVAQAFEMPTGPKE